MKVSIDKFSKVPVYLQIADQIKSQIISGALPRGSALPSERALAQILDVHRNTVVKALCLHVAHTCNLNCSYCSVSYTHLTLPTKLEV